MSAAGPSGNVRRFVETKLRAELNYGCDSGVDTWKRVTSFANHVRRSFLVQYAR